MCNDLNIPEKDAKKEFEAIVRMLLEDAPECSDRNRSDE